MKLSGLVARRVAAVAALQQSSWQRKDWGANFRQVEIMREVRRHASSYAMEEAHSEVWSNHGRSCNRTAAPGQELMVHVRT